MWGGRGVVVEGEGGDAAGPRLELATAFWSMLRCRDPGEREAGVRSLQQR